MTTRILGGKGNRTRRSRKASCRATTSRRPPTRYERSHTRKVNLCIIQVLLNTFLMGVPVVLGKALGRTNIGCEVIRNTIGDEEGVGFDVAEKQVKDSEWSWDFSNGGELRCPSRLLWISPSSVEQMFNSEKIQPDAGARLSPERQQNAGPAVFVSGSFRKDGTSATLDPVFLLPAGSLLDEVPTSGTYCAVFEGQGGTIAQYCPDLAFTLPDGFADEPGETELEEDIFGFAVAVPSGATKVALTFDGAELTSRTASANPPTVVFTDPQPGGRWDGGMQTIAWSGADADGDALSYMLLASRDGAEDWTLLDSRLTREDFDVNADLANGGPNVYFRVLASDGLQTAEATVGPIDVVQRPAISVIPEAIDIGPVVAGFDHQQGFVLINEGSGSLNVNAIESDNPVFQVLAPETPFDIPAQAAARVTLRYAPTSVGLEAAVLTVRSNATNQPELKINISANAVEATTPTIRVSEQSLGFGEVPTGQSLTVPLVISNLSSAELSVEYQLAGGAYSLVDSPASPFVLVGVDQEIIQIRFAPDREGEFAGSLRITSNDPNQPVIDLELAGAGIPPVAVSGPTPSISAGGVVNAASFETVISPGSWVTIFGQNLAGSTTTWDGAIQGTDLPTVVAGVQVLFDGRPGAVSFVSPRQINVQAPDGVDGQVEVRVIVNGLAGQASIAEVRALAPALFTYGPGQTRHAAAVHLDGVFVGPDDLFGGVVPTRPAQAGDRILVFGSGFGPTNPPVPAGLLFLGAARLTNSVRVLIGSGEAVVEFAGLSGAGLNQFNVIVPDGLPSGDHEIVIEVGSQQTQPGVRLSVTGSVGGPGSGPIEIQLLDAELTSPEVGLLSYSWSAAFSDTRARSLRIDVVLSVDEQIGGTDVVLLSEIRETRQGQSGLGVQDVAIIPQDVPDDDYFIGILITDLGSGEESRSNVLPLEIAR